MFSSPWRVFFYVGHHFFVGEHGVEFSALQVRQRLTRIVLNPTRRRPRQALWLPVHPLDAVSEALPLLDAVYAHYVAQWPKIMSDITNDEDEFGRGFFLDGADLPEQIADPSHADELDVIAWRNIPTETRRYWEEVSGGDLNHALAVDPHLFEWEYKGWCGPADKIGVEPYPG